MRRGKSVADWRDKVNPLFALAIQFLGVMPRLIKEIAASRENASEQAHTILIEATRRSMRFLPPSSPEAGLQTHHEFADLWATLDKNDWLRAPDVRKATVEVAGRIQNAPRALLTVGFDKPHWWMPYSSWSEVLGKERLVESLFNVLALLHFQIPLRELTQRITEGDPELSARLFGSFQDSRPAPERLLENLSDAATRIVGRALLLKGEPPGYQLQLRMVLFFGWDFGLCNLSVKDLHTFLFQMDVVPSSYNPESLRRYRDRLRQLIRRAPAKLLPGVSSSGLE
ncbi:MAG TPA: hypothetical protein VFQ43_12355 [Nitrososphaera sp.]|nr:hypothetical protein [Nitrososphaera sp.]